MFGQRTCLGLRSVAEAKARRSEVMACGLAILDINLGHGVPSGVDAYHWLRDQGFAGRIVFLTGHAHDLPLVRRATQLGDAEVYLKPITADALKDLVEEPR